MKNLGDVFQLSQGGVPPPAVRALRLIFAVSSIERDRAAVRRVLRGKGPKKYV